MNVTVTITDITKGPFQVLALFSQNPPTGVTVAVTPTATRVPGGKMRIQSSPRNGNTTVYTGDSHTASDGSNQGCELLSGDVDDAHLSDDWDVTYINASANSAVVNVELHGGR